MSHAANNYIKKLKAAPGGEAITSTERALLWYLADGHNEEQGNFHFAGIKLLAAHCGVEDRQMRRIIRSVEEKGIIARIYAKRPNGSHTVNRYVFPALGYVCPECSAAVAPMEDHKCVETGKKQRKVQATAQAGKNTRKSVKKAGGKRTENGANVVEKPVDAAEGMTGPSCHAVQDPPVAHDSTPPVTEDRSLLSPTTALTTNLSTGSSLTNSSTNLSTEGHDGDEEISSDSISKEKTARANVSQPGGLTALRDIAGVLPAGKWDGFKLELQRQIDRMPAAVKPLATELYRRWIDGTTLEAEACDGDVLTPTWTITSDDPRETQKALDTLSEPVKAALWKTAKGNVHVRVIGGAES